ncbi:30S ribosomal protein S20 [Acidimicrobiia bacterium]|jgi:small subunit ribosomal protein S20|nr:30S ribosomal protein S20 [Acidimicrobiia bacterium]MDA9275343.1 30S ribosomal protein S20 [Acidimicrobiia bacterium]MDA9645710.1 30S ribosomal protein S20 [Candidatus Actinomarina sp.]MDB4249615.1 30S ribosomal protein S20 [Acidimicrobiia bacterium]MDC1071246.1 30S ribosomal protein S20 [Acidimicrobiia bacterium]|tara:strand:+ start:266 stop:502 length:237 start_codon:yes stop_codon:yes gene_type:complete
MANIKSQKKRIRQDAKKNLRNKSIKTELKSSLKSLYDDNNEVVIENKAAVIKELDKAFTDGIISKNYRDRNKSRISKL